MTPSVLLFFTALAVIYDVANGQNIGTACDLGSDKPGDANATCKLLKDCPIMMQIFNKENKTNNEILLLNKTQCGPEGVKSEHSKVCCPEPCLTPEGLPGKCKGIYSCPQLLKLFRQPTSITSEGVTYIRNSICTSVDTYSVCCGPPSQNVPLAGSTCESTVTAFPPDPDTDCCGVGISTGIRTLQGPILYPEQHPWLAIIEYTHERRTKPLCGGTLISGRYVLTAGHCVTGNILKDNAPTNVRLGEYDIANEGPDCFMIGMAEDCTYGTVTIPIENTTSHPDYHSSMPLSPNDIALVRLAKNAPFTDFIRPICLPKLDVTANPPKYFTMHTAGWGGFSSTSLVKSNVALPYVEKKACEATYKSSRKSLNLTNRQLCAGGDPSQDSCKGDSGGPLMYQNGRHYEVIGVISFGPVPCAKSNVPEVFTKVYQYIDWIRSTIVA